MKEMTLATIAEVTQGELMVPQSADIVIERIATDSRIDLNGAVFVALRGARFDAHEFVESAAANGARALLVERQVAIDLPQIIVADNQRALAHLAEYQRQAFNIPTIALTGSCGKTTTKEMLNSILGQLGEVHATEGNYNNEYGVPFTMFRLEESHNFSVVEMGAARPGDINYLTTMVKPDVALITCIAEAHLEGMGNLEGVAKTKGEILDGLTDTGTAILPLEHAWLSDWQAKLKPEQRLLTFGTGIEPDVFATQPVLETDRSQFLLHYKNDTVRVELPLPGQHNIINALAASAAAIVFGAGLEDCARGLNQASASVGRMVSLFGRNRSHIIDDSYNANPSAILAAANILSEYSGKRILVLGDMAELGENSKLIHYQTGHKLRHFKIDQLLTVGTLSASMAEGFGSRALHFNSKETLVEYLQPMLSHKTHILVKGSRSSRMEEVIHSLVDAQSTEEEML